MVILSFISCILQVYIHQVSTFLKLTYLAGNITCCLLCLTVLQVGDTSVLWNYYYFGINYHFGIKPFCHQSGLCWLPACFRNICWLSVQDNVVSEHLMQIVQGINKKYLKKQLQSSWTVISHRVVVTGLQQSYSCLMQLIR